MKGEQAKESEKAGEQTKSEKRLFFTTSDFVKKLNANIAELEDPQEVHKPRFELQKKLPDGSTRRAYDDELAAADMQTKLKQAAEQVSFCKKPEEKIEWAHEQRQEGNKLYSAGAYKEAMDVYLSCLVAKPEGAEYETLYSTEIVLPVLNNLAQASLQLGMYRKAETFCTIAIDEIIKREEGKIAIITTQPEQEKEDKGQRVADNKEPRKQMAKLYFRRGKSRRLRGTYDEAKKDIEEALNLIDSNEASEKKALERELQKINQAAMLAKKNIKRQEKAMQQILGGGTKAVNNTIERDEGTTEHSQDNHDNRSAPMSVPLVESATPQQPDVSDQAGLYSDLRQRRAFSTLKAKPKKKEEHTRQNEVRSTPMMDEDIELSCWQHYLIVIGALAEKALEWIGDEETSTDLNSDRDE